MATKKEETIVVSNTSPLIFFLQIKKLDVLKELFGKILITNEVYNEIKNTEQKEALNKEIKRGWIKKKSTPKLNILNNLDIGEASSISLALQYEQALFIADDLQARNLAKSIGLEITGTIGIILLAKKLGFIEKEFNLQKELISSNLWISTRLFQQLKELF